MNHIFDKIIFTVILVFLLIGGRYIPRMFHRLVVLAPLKQKEQFSWFAVLALLSMTSLCVLATANRL